MEDSDLLQQISENTQPTYILNDVEARLGNIEHELRIMNEFLRDIVETLNQ
ncbi:hypothetical protein [Corynebacterium lactis]|uniref:Uncharacterized protein n=1 Tax=Corynebacterium lactis RW2-5 TaxID=1408189 RepID=A0A0K2H315_9CORY|nr:hypothetical protein [Corynebacterium lactis]ALA68429.1 hypothetical protein CLAC_03290 [Corynebacterium lactis RW2-5]